VRSFLPQNFLIHFILEKTIHDEEASNVDLAESVAEIKVCLILKNCESR
jgi:hypothetical protein